MYDRKSDGKEVAVKPSVQKGGLKKRMKNLNAIDYWTGPHVAVGLQ